jgi:hypothetical protein
MKQLYILAIILLPAWVATAIIIFRKPTWPKDDPMPSTHFNDISHEEIDDAMGGKE